MKNIRDYGRYFLFFFWLILLWYTHKKTEYMKCAEKKILKMVLKNVFHKYTAPIFKIFFLFFSFIFISWRLITSQHCSGFCHTLAWISHGVTYIPHPDPPSHLPLSPIPLGLPSAPGLSTCLMHPTWAGDLFHYR